MFGALITLVFGTYLGISTAGKIQSNRKARMEARAQGKKYYMTNKYVYHTVDTDEYCRIERESNSFANHTVCVTNNGRVIEDYTVEKVDEYNKAHGTSYLAAPEGAISFDKSSLTIKADTESSADTLWVKFSDTAEQLLTDKAGYVIPVVISSCDGEGYRPSTNMSTKYIVVALEESAVRVGGTQSEMLGTAITDYSSWTSTPNGFQSLFSGSSWSRRYAIGENPGVFTLDMQTTQNLTGIAVYAMYANYIRWYGNDYKPQSLAVEISSDGSSFTSLGKLSGDDLIVDSSGYAWFDLYGPMPCRYIRVTIEWAPGLSSYSYYWSLAGFRAYAE